MQIRPTSGKGVSTTTWVVVPSEPFRGEREQAEASCRSTTPNLSILTSTYRDPHEVRSTRPYPMALGLGIKYIEFRDLS